MTSFGRLLTAMATPFDADGSLDLDRAKRLASALLDSGTEGLVVCGTTGESPTLSNHEKLSLLEVACEVAHARGAPVIAGTTTYNTAESIELSREAQHVGVDAILGTVPYYNNPPQEGLFQHFSAIARAVDLPMILYNIPSRSPRNMEAATTLRLAEIPNIVAVKEASGNVSQMCDICRAVPPDFIVLSGDDALTLPLMAVGGRGIISVASNEIPGDMVQMVEAAERNDFASARAVHARILPLMTVNFVESNPIPVKAAMADMGLLDEQYRLPMVPPRPESRDKIRKVLSELGLLKAAMV